MLRRLTLDNSRLGLLLLYTAFVLPFTTWMSVGTFRNIPRDLEDAARIDGCSQLQAFLREFDVFWNEMAAATVMMSLPLIIIFLFVQKFFVRGLTEGALSG